MPFLLQVHPRGLAASASVNGVPPAKSIRLSLLSAKKAIDRPLGDHAERPALKSVVVPGRTRGLVESKFRIHNATLFVSSGASAQKATLRPSGETAGAGSKANFRAGGVISSHVAGQGDD